jgi:hypothetical protein
MEHEPLWKTRLKVLGKILFALIFVTLCILTGLIAARGQAVLSANVDLNRTNANNAETMLTPSNVHSGTFKLLGNYAVDGYIFSQPLYVPGITTSGATRNLVIVVTLNNSVYAFDAANPGGTPVWSNLHFATTYTGYPAVGTPLYSQGLGCLSTPVADVVNLKLYVVCDTSTPNWVLRQLNLTTGATLQTVTISGQVVGTGDTGSIGGVSPPGVPDTTSGPNLLFYPQYEFQRAGLALSADLSTVYIGFGGLDDSRPYHGWLMAYATSNLSQIGIWCSTNNSWGGAIWMSGGAPAIDSAGNVYVTTGNGYRTADPTAVDNAVMQLSANLSVGAAYFPPDEAADDSDDADQASNRFLLIPGSGLGVAAGKDFNVYVLTLSTMSLSQASFKTNAGGSPGSASGSYGMAFLNNTLFLPVTSGGIYGFAYSSGAFNTTPTTQSNSYGFPGPAQMLGSSNSGSNGVLWAVTCASGTHNAIEQGIVRAINPSTLAEYWNSNASGSDTLGHITKFAAPLVAGGKVFVSTQDSKVQIYGLVSSGTVRGATTVRGHSVIR